MFTPVQKLMGRSRAYAKPMDRILGRTRLQVDQNDRAILLSGGKAAGVYGPGEHVFDTPFQEFGFVVESLTGDAPTVKTGYALAALREGLGGAEMVEMRTGAGEIGLVSRDGALYALLPPETRVAYWTALGPFTMETIAPRDGEEIPAALVGGVFRAQTGALGAKPPGGYLPAVALSTATGHQTAVFVGGAFAGLYESGLRGFWSPNNIVTPRVIDRRMQIVEVSGQEMLTADRVSLRLSAAATYRIADPEAALTKTASYDMALYLALQLALRATVSARTLDALLNERVAIDGPTLERLRKEMAEIGIELGAVEVKDVILPGDMREILNRVVLAEKEAEANVIKRREETAATRSLLNTAKIMAENPVMMRLKELEAMESVAGKVERLIVYGGPKGLLDAAKLESE